MGDKKLTPKEHAERTIRALAIRKMKREMESKGVTFEEDGYFPRETDEYAAYVRDKRKHR